MFRLQLGDSFQGEIEPVLLTVVKGIVPPLNQVPGPNR